jgi:uncharacterized membrane protein
MLLKTLIYLHVMSLSLWFGGLFGYVVMVWPAIMSDAEGTFPRAILARIGMRTAPWIYLAMAAALLSLAGIWVTGGVAAQQPWIAGYSLLLAALVANNVYGTTVAWPRIMLLPQQSAGREFFWFRVRMGVALVVGLFLYSAAIIAT